MNYINAEVIATGGSEFCKYSLIRKPGPVFIFYGACRKAENAGTQKKSKEDT